MQQFRQADVIRTLLNEYCHDSPFTEIYEAGPDIYHLAVRRDKDYPKPTSIFGPSYYAGKNIELTKNIVISVIHIGYTTESIRYVEAKVKTNTIEYL